MKCIFKYPGSKWSMTKWITDHFPEHHSYLEPFFGSGAVFFNKPRSKIETINDLDNDIVNFFMCMARDPELLSEKVSSLPYARIVFEHSVDEITKPFSFENPDYDRALMFVAKTMMGHGFRTCEIRTGFKRDIQGRQAAYAAGDWANLPDVIRKMSDRLKGVQIENRPAVRLIREFNYPNVLIYADPPYVKSSRSCSRDLYRHEMTDEDHEELLDVLIRHKGPVIISGYDNPLYNDRLKDWKNEQIEARTQVQGKSTEVIWMNFDSPMQTSIL